MSIRGRTCVGSTTDFSADQIRLGPCRRQGRHGICSFGSSGSPGKGGGSCGSYSQQSQSSVFCSQAAVGLPAVAMTTVTAVDAIHAAAIAVGATERFPVGYRNGREAWQHLICGRGDVGGGVGAGGKADREDRSPGCYSGTKYCQLLAS